MNHRAFAFLMIAFVCHVASAQQRLKTLPGYDRYQRLAREIPGSVKPGVLSVTWIEDGAALEFDKGGKRYRYDIEARELRELPPKESGVTNRNSRTRSSGERRERGRQFTAALSPDGKLKAFYRDRNVWLSDTNGSNVVAVTTEGNERDRLKFGSANWVYGEELDQITAMWWSSNSQQLAFYRFDERGIPDYHLALHQTRLQTTLDAEPYMKVGTTNPLVDILIHDLASKTFTRIDVRDGQPFDDSVVGHYVYGVSWHGDELLFRRTNRRQNVMELCAAHAATGKVRVVVREEWPASWVENSPTLRWLEDGQRFIWSSERTGWRNFYLYNFKGELIRPLTQHRFEVADIVRVVEKDGVLFYSARSGDNPMKLQLHRVGLDGSGDVRLTDPAYHHSVDVAPDGRYFVDTAQTHARPPVTSLRDAGGRCVAELNRSDTKRFEELRLRPVERFTFKADDGETDLYGLLHFPSRFNPALRYPLIVTVYAGPGTVGARETFTLPSTLTEMGFLVASFDSRSASGRGKRFLDSIYLKFGTVEIADQAAGVRWLARRRYVDARRVGIYGTSYGGYATVAAMLKHPDLFHVGVASSAVTDFRNYDTIYTERYMWVPRENKAGYDAANLLNYATNLTGRLMLFYGTADNNVHPANSLQLVEALRKAGKSFDMQVGPDEGHTSFNREGMLEYFVEHLIVNRPRTTKKRQ